MAKKNETVKGVSYSGSQRVAVVEQKVSRADDAAHLGELYFRMSDFYRRLDMEIPEDERVLILADLAEVEAEIEEYCGYLNGYGG